jgi:HEAT repeat protein
MRIRSFILAPTVRAPWGRPPNVEKLARKENVKGLVRALRYEDPISDTGGRTADLGVEVRAAAAAALGHLDTPAANAGLMSALEDPEERVRVAAVRALRERGGTTAVAPLMSAAASWTDPAREEAREEAVEALASAHHPDVLREMVAALLARPEDLEEPDADVVRRLAEATGAPAALRDTIEDLIAHLVEPATAPRARTLLVWLAPESVEPLIAAAGDETAAPEAARALGAIRDSRAVVPLSSLVVSSEDPLVRAAAAWALGEIRDPSAVGALLAATSDGDYAVRAEALEGFDKLGNAAIAVAMSMLVQPMLENGARRAEEVEGDRTEELAAAAPGELPAEASGAGAAADASGAGPTEPEPSAPVQEPGVAVAAPAAPSPAQQPLATRAAPYIRRLLGR